MRHYRTGTHFLGFHYTMIPIRGGLIGYVKSEPLGTGQIISIDVLVIMMIIIVFHKKVDLAPRNGHFKIEAPSVGFHSLNYSFVCDNSH